MTALEHNNHHNDLHQPIAIIGMGCRFPGGANSPQTFWQLLKEGVDAITEIPPTRWNVNAFYDPDQEKSGKSYTRWGGFIEDVDRFDAHFFGISPREATRMDPQHRLLLEVAWEALEDGGQIPADLAGSKTGVFVGVASHDYADIQSSVSERRLMNAYTNLGSAMSIAANRLSYFFDFLGPSLAVDTACSSALVAVHLACQSIWTGESDLALAGGVQITLRPESTIGFSKASMLAPDGRCKSFDARANGFVRSEGAGLVLLKPYRQAVQDGDSIVAVILGTAVNQDGRTQGITVPSGASQEAVLVNAYRQTSVDPAQVRYVETHGTGTPVGDPIEAKALGHVLSRNRPPNKTCFIGSVKTNIGHSETAAGIAGLIKAALVVKQGQIPPNLHFETPNPEIPFDDLQLQVPQRLEPWPDTAYRIAGVNAFGFGGTNAHVVLADRPLLEIGHAENMVDRPAPSQNNGKSSQTHILSKRTGVSSGKVPLSGRFLLPLSARSHDALLALAQAYQRFLTHETSASLVDIGYSAGMHRTHHHHRLAVAGHNKGELIKQLKAFIAGDQPIGVSSGQPLVSPKLAFVFSGMGPQWWAMGCQLLEKEAVFRETIEQCDTYLQGYTGWSLLAELTAAETESRINQTEIAQPAIFAIQVALSRLWRSWGVEPEIIVGHSVGEVAAAHLAGVLSLEDALNVVFHRSRLQATTAGQGQMLAAGLSEKEANLLLAGYTEQVSIAAINSPRAVTLAGDGQALVEIAGLLELQGIFHRFLQVEVPYHSPQMEPIKAELATALQDINPQTTAIPLFSTVTGAAVAGPELDEVYWGRNIREPVRFAGAIEGLTQAGANIFLEIAPHPVLAGSVKECLAVTGVEGMVLPSLRRNQPEQEVIFNSLGQLYTLGYSPDWPRLYPGGHFVKLPMYPWQRKPYWSETEASQRARQVYSTRAALDDDPDGTPHPLLGSRLKAVHPLWTVQIDKQEPAYLKDHQVQGAVVYPAAAYVEMALTAAHKSLAQNGAAGGSEAIELAQIEFQRALFLSDEPVTLQTTLSGNAFEIYSQSKPHWTQHAVGTVRRLQGDNPIEPLRLDEIQHQCSTTMPRSDLYEHFRDFGLEYGPAFQGIERLWSGPGEALGQLRWPEHEDLADYHLHPALLDACFQVMLGVVASDKGGVYLPIQIETLWVWSLDHQPGGQLWGYARLVEQGADHLVGEIRLLDEAGTILVDIQGFRCQAVGSTGEAEASIDDLLYEYQWTLQPHFQEAWPAADFIPSPVSLAKSNHAEAIRLYNQLDRGRYYQEIRPRSNQLATAYIMEALRQLGWRPEVGQRITVDSLAKMLNMAPQHHRLLGRLFEFLAEDGILKPLSDGTGDQYWAVDHIPDLPESRDIWNGMIREYPAYTVELILLGRCGQNLANVLTGEIDPLELIFPEGSTITEQFYQNDPSFLIPNMLARNILHKILERLPEGRPLRILEIGAGTGSLTSYLLPILPANQTEYIFTDISAVFGMRAADKFSQYPFVDYQTLDIENDPLQQGFEAHAFDIILASNVLHATADLRHTLANVKRLLASSGLLLLTEATAPPRSLELIFGLLKGWWLFSDFDLRSINPLLSAPKWVELLSGVGFSDVTGLSEFGTALVDSTLDDNPIKAEHDIILARGPELQPAAPPALASDTSRNWLIFADGDGKGQQLAEYFQQQGQSAVMVSPGEKFERLNSKQFQIRPEQAADYEQFLTALANDPPTGVVFLWGFDLRHENLTAASLESTNSLACLSLLYLVQTLTQADYKARLWLVTWGSQQLGDTPVSVAQAPVWTMGRVVMTEHPELACTLIDLSREASPDELHALLFELLSDNALSNNAGNNAATVNEDEIALRGTDRYIHRLRQVKLADISRIPPENSPFYLEVTTPGILENLTFKSLTRRPPGPGEVEIQVVATALNFNDVAKAMGLLSEASLTGTSSGRAVGLECSGKISAVGQGVTDLQVGDDVIAFAPKSLSTYTVTPACFVMPKPAGMSFEEAATIPVVFATVHYALHHLGRIQKGERILIHAAAGGVGLAAIQIAQTVGAEIFATAGNPEKRAFLRSLGVQHVMDSRSTAFADEVMAMTEGRGVDLVLNSLAGELLELSLSVLAPYGRFLELGKRDIQQNNKLGLRPFQKNLSFFAIDLDRLSVERPEKTASLFKEVIEGFTTGVYHALPHRVFPISEVASAFRYMAQAKHIGKVVVALPRHHQQDQIKHSITVVESQPDQITFRAKATYLITGGLGGVGLAVAQWMVDHGARHLVLMGRRGAASPAAKQAVAALREAGATIVVAKADVSQAEQVAEVLANIPPETPLRGIIHAAMVLDDATLLQLDAARLQNVMAPKINGAWHLHTQTLDLPLDFFVLFSSFTSVVGNPGQANYVAANGFLDMLAHDRRVQNLPALTVNWGFVGEVGYVAENSNIRHYVERFGAKSIAVRQILTILGQLIRHQVTQATVLALDWPQWGRSQPAGKSPRFAHLVSRTGPDGARSETQAGLLQLLKTTPSAERRTFLQQHLRAQLAKVLGMSDPEQVELRQGFFDMGLDSLMAVELKNRLEATLECTLPQMLLFNYPSLEELTHYLISDVLSASILFDDTPSASSTTRAEAEEESVSSLPDDLSEDEIAEMLAKKLGVSE
jgi:acyl transferase domain-containing protein/acyl carrier protein